MRAKIRKLFLPELIQAFGLVCACRLDAVSRFVKRYLSQQNATVAYKQTFKSAPARKLDLTHVDVFYQLTLSASRLRLAETGPRGASCDGPDRLWRAGRDTHLHLHAEMVRWEPDEGAVERDRVVRIAHDCNGDKADVADAAARGVEIDPAGARQIDLRPGMGRPARGLLRVKRDGEIPGRKPARQNRTSAPPRSSAWRNRGSCHGRAGASRPAAGFPSLPAAGKGSSD
jgi:hypothetical protein